MTSNHATDICDSKLTDEDRLEFWPCLYFTKYNNFPIKQLNDAIDEATKKLYDELTKITITEYVNEKLDLKHFGLALGIVKAEDNIDKVKEIVQYGVQTSFDKSVEKAVAIRTAVVKGVVESSVRGNAGTLGRRGAIVVLEKSAALAGGQAASKTFTALCNPVMGIGAAVGEFAAVSLCHALGIDNPTVVLAAGVGAGILTAAIAGASVAGPIGAGFGAAVGI